MRRVLPIVLVLIIANTGCISQALRRRTINQAETWSDIVYRQVMENLAMVADNPDVLPCYSMIDAGSTTLTDTYSLPGVLNLPANSTGNGTIDPTVKRAVGGNWTYTQVTGPEKLRAMRLAFKYAVYRDINILRAHDRNVTLDSFRYPIQVSGSPCVAYPKPDGSITCDSTDPSQPGFYYNVACELAEIPQGWLGIGTRCQVSKCARFVAHCHGTSVWVTEEGMAGLSRFTLVIQYIARTPADSLYAPAAVQTTVPVENIKLDKQPVITNCDAFPLKVKSVQLPINCYGQVILLKQRLDSIQITDNKLKSALSGAAKTQ